jgi:hypothetical protein
MSEKEQSETSVTGGDDLLHRDVALVHRYVDGDLTAAERAELVRRAGGDPSIAQRIEGVLEVGALTQAAAMHAGQGGAADGIDADALFAKIESAIEMEASSDGVPVARAVERARPDLRVLEGGAAKGAGRDAARKSGSTPAMPPDVRRRRLIGLVIGGLAVAAAAVIAFTMSNPTEETVAVEDPGVSPSVGPGNDGTEAPGPTELAPDELAEANRTEVLEVDFGTNVGSIFSVEGDDGERYVVIWLDETDAGTEIHD